MNDLNLSRLAGGAGASAGSIGSVPGCEFEGQVQLGAMAISADGVCAPTHKMSPITTYPQNGSNADGVFAPLRPGGNPGASLKSISHRCHPILVAFVWELIEETITLPLGCLQGGWEWSTYPRPLMA